MLDNESWLRLIQGLASATQSDRLLWEAKPNRVFGSELARAAAGELGTTQAYIARTGPVAYELRANQGFARPPFELDVWEEREGAVKHVGTAASSADIAISNQLPLNNAVANLYALVSSTTESPEELVTRLLGEIPPPQE